MSTEQNREIVLRWFERMNGLMAGTTEVPVVYEDFADDATYWTVGHPDSGSQVVGVHHDGKDAILAFTSAGFAGEHALFAPGPQHSIVPNGITAEGDRVAVEAESNVYLKSGAHYNNRYHFLFIIEDGRVKAVREYCDTAHIAQVIG